ncbi:unnamed protein product, partial [Gongylonema pulchrum]|uniref:Peptidase_M1 domain-containing protein n=1 Tax=Gongylonema pulchrum TaxID=637853 RepID=A0A183DYM6_9BILA
EEQFFAYLTHFAQFFSRTIHQNLTVWDFQEVTLGPWPHLVYRTIGGMLDITFFPGPKPEDVIKQYLTFIGKPYLPAYFAFGFQLCRFGYTGLDEMKAVVSRVQKVGVPLDVVYADIDYMERYTDFTVGKVRELREILHQLKSENQSVDHL